MITSYQISNIENLEARSGRSWTEFAAADAVSDLTSEEAVTVLKGLLVAAGIKPQPVSTKTSRRTGQSGRCGCGAPLDHLSAGGYCHDCQ